MNLFRRMRAATALGLTSLNGADLERLKEGARIVEEDHRGIKVLGLRDGSFLKMVRRKGPLSLAWLFPYAMRFARNAQVLRQRGIDCPQIIACYRAQESELDMIHYWPVPGETVRACLSLGGQAELLEKVGSYIARLHEQGIYFRALHLGNIVRGDDGHLALIDIADVRFSQRPLRRWVRRRNFRNILRYREDRRWLSEEAAAMAFWRGYGRDSSVPMGVQECR